MTAESNAGLSQPRSREVERHCPHCGECHTVQVVVEPGWETVVYCKRTGVVG